MCGKQCQNRLKALDVDVSDNVKDFIKWKDRVTNETSTCKKDRREKFYTVKSE